MENDLLTEEDFLAPKPTPTPWKYLAVFCLIALVQVVLLFVSIRLFRDAINAMALGTTVLVLPLLTIFTMFFGRKANRYLPKKTISGFILILLGFYCVPVLSISVIAGTATLRALVAVVGSYIIYFLVCLAIIIPIAGRAQNRRAKLK